MKNNKPKLNSALTSRVIDLHDQGYTDDFLSVKDECFLCLQNSENFSLADLNIQVIDQGFDQFSKTYKYIHTVETANGNKGLLIGELMLAELESVN
ncbi:hypothetical protein [Mucilaginibacter sp. FT3.2]|uniref:hypothetical protein n=1 Tax=Mucilaginibacter sp. FT3.2 TaxID=2723090 RepID=UPI00160C998A|nr:hypothetical protein [Mucilaginibacter sp. FT3.2]MBB6231175.1 hypothetical protein [Mucilaginibacter sp. FT3.2]